MMTEREPTRAMSSPTAETADLGLAPLDDDQAMPAQKPAAPVAKTGGSSIHDDIALAPVEDEVEVNPAAAGTIDLPPLEESGEAASPVAAEPR